MAKSVVFIRPPNLLYRFKSGEDIPVHVLQPFCQIGECLCCQLQIPACGGKRTVSHEMCIRDRCPEELGKALILPLTIQPLLENAIRYGMEEMMDTCEISIRTMKEGELLIVEVSNEGSVFEDSLLEKLQDGTKMCIRDRYSTENGICSSVFL